MIVKREYFERFLELVIAKGSIQTKEAILIIKPNQLKIASSNGNFLVYAKYNTPTGETDDEIRVGIDDLLGFKKIINGFKSKELSIFKSRNTFVVASNEDKHKVTFNLQKPEYIIVTIPEEKIEGLVNSNTQFPISFTEANIKEILTQAKTLNVGVINLVCDGTSNKIKVVLKERDRKELETYIETENAINPSFNVNFGESFLDLLTTIKVGFNACITEKGILFTKTNNDELDVISVITPLNTGF